MLTIGSLIRDAVLDIIWVCSAIMGPKKSLTYCALSTFLATPIMNSWRNWFPFSSTDANYLINWVVNSPKVASSSVSKGKESSDFTTGGNPTLSNNILILCEDDSNILFDETSGASPSFSAYLVCYELPIIYVNAPGDLEEEEVEGAKGMVVDDYEGMEGTMVAEVVTGIISRGEVMGGVVASGVQLVYDNL
eukprot:Gb_07683 [translate_table: standard]